MTQKFSAYISRRWVEMVSAYRFVVNWILDARYWILDIGYWKVRKNGQLVTSGKLLMPLIFILFSTFFSCGEPEIKLDRAARRTVDTLVNRQLDSISPMLDSLCTSKKDSVIQYLADSIIKERRKQEERLRLNIPKNN